MLLLLRTTEWGPERVERILNPHFNVYMRAARTVTSRLDYRRAYREYIGWWWRREDGTKWSLYWGPWYALPGAILPERHRGRPIYGKPTGVDLKNLRRQGYEIVFRLGGRVINAE